jgi:hypothetical protein
MKVPIKIGLLGAFDRNNYGDLLFPIVAEEYLKELKPHYSFEYVSLAESDLSEWGAKKTIRMSSFLKSTDHQSVIIVTGGEVLGALWKNMFANLLDPSKDRFYRWLFRRYNDRNWFTKFIKWKFGCAHTMPWVIERKTLPSPKTLIVYNAVGAAGTWHLKPSQMKELGSNVADADLFSTRDATSVEIMKKVNPKINPVLVPDSAVLISQMFPLAKLEALISEEARKAALPSQSFFCLQIGLHFCHTEEARKEVVLQVDRIIAQTGLSVLLLPIGRALYHEDDKVLEAIASKLETKDYFLPNNNTIYDTMYYIAQARFFAGTSLHGNITALAYAVPQMALSDLDRKVPAFMKTWGIEGNDQTYPFSAMNDTVEKILSISKEALEEKKESLQKQTIQHFENIKNMILQHNKEA